MRIGYHASHEQYPPSELLALVREAEAAGFEHVMCSDHFAPFTEQQGESGFTWSWLGAAMTSTDLTFGTVNAPGQRYHPAIIAQAIATLAELFPGRIWVAFGSGQYINEQFTGEGWPAKGVRNERLRESVEVIRRLLRGETVTQHGHVTVEDARLYTLPRQMPQLFAAAITPETAEWAAGWADGLITVYQPDGRMQETVGAFRSGGGAGKPIFLQAQHGFGPTDEEALEDATERWGQAVLSSSVTTDLRYPAQIAEAAAWANVDEIAPRIRVSSDPLQHLEWVDEYRQAGFDAVYIHNVCRWQREFIHAFGKSVLPRMLAVPQHT